MGIEHFFVIQESATVRLDIRYASTDNFTGAVLPGYHKAKAWLIEDCRLPFERAHKWLNAKGLGLIVWDAYRPRKATLAMLEWARAQNRWDLVLDGYIAENSRHNSAAALDVGLFQLADGEPLDMGSEWDCFESISNTYNVSGDALRNRLLLREGMMQAGWEPYDVEWWHFELPAVEVRATFDVAYC